MLKILVADDHRLVREGLKKIIEQARDMVVSAGGFRRRGSDRQNFKIVIRYGASLDIFHAGTQRSGRSQAVEGQTS